MGSSPTPPPPPDYAAANKAGVEADISTLPLRRAIEQASALGEGAVYNKKYYKNADEAQAKRREDFAGIDAAMSYANQQYATAGEGMYGGFQRQDAQQKLNALQKQREGLGEVGDFTGLGDDALSRKYLGIALDGGDELARRQLKMRQEQGVANVEQTVKELRAADPAAYDNRLKIQRQIEGDMLHYDPEAGDLGKILKDARADYALGSKLDDSTAHEVEQSARAAQSARGSILGIGAAAQEAMALGSAGEQRRLMRRDALGSADAASYGRQQQNLASASSFLLGSPITNQFGNLQGAQSGAVNYQPQGATRGIGQDAGAGARAQGFAQQNYSQSMDAYNQQKAQGNPWMNIASGVVGKAAGAFSGGLGSGAAASIFAK